MLLSRLLHYPRRVAESSRLVCTTFFQSFIGKKARERLTDGVCTRPSSAPDDIKAAPGPSVSQQTHPPPREERTPVTEDKDFCKNLTWTSATATNLEAASALDPAPALTAPAPRARKAAAHAVLLDARSVHPAVCVRVARPATPAAALSRTT